MARRIITTDDDFRAGMRALRRKCPAMRRAYAVADRVYVLQKGKVEFSGPSQQLRDDASLRDRLLAV